MFFIREEPEEGRAAMRFNCSMTATDCGHCQQYDACASYRADGFGFVSREAAENSVCLFAFPEASVRVGWNRPKTESSNQFCLLSESPGVGREHQETGIHSRGCAPRDDRRPSADLGRSAAKGRRGYPFADQDAGGRVRALAWEM